MLNLGNDYRSYTDERTSQGLRGAPSVFTHEKWTHQGQDDSQDSVSRLPEVGEDSVSMGCGSLPCGPWTVTHNEGCVWSECLGEMTSVMWKLPRQAERLLVPESSIFVP